MNIYLDFITLFDVFCIVQGLTTATWLFWTPNKPANRWLAWLILGLTLQTIDYFLSRSGVYYRHRSLYFMPLFFSWSFGPLFYGYVRALTNKPPTISRFWLLPVVVQVLFYCVLTVQTLDTKAWFWQTVHKPYTRYVDYYVGCGLMLYFLARSWKTIESDNPAGNWLNGLIKSLAVFYVIAAIDPLVNATYLAPNAPRFYLTTLALPFFAYMLALTGLFRDRFKRVVKQPPIIVSADQQERLRRAMSVDKLYRNPDLTLAVLAEHLGLTTNAVSRLINAGFDRSFADFVNAYRVDEVKQRLAAGEADRVTILALGLDAGFSSKTTFNRVFKEQTGFTPKDYEKKSQITPWDDTAPETL
ncbi:helix-turn-helix domain-containing protein [uncultured Fibrella sp.]|uniref:helix-turn-helix domain-containing protein n=1 Tax=uncultured Fibrella sp. TaxID=1284596 RepID=UPI0035CBAC9F